MFSFCTLFDENYLSKGLALFESLNNHCEAMVIYVLCLDNFTFEYLSKAKLKNIISIRLSELEDFDKELLSIKNSRTSIEYYFTISPCLPLFLLKTNPKLKWICSLDADIYFYNNPQSIFNDFERKYSILITPHKFTPELLLMGIEKYGLYNVSFQAFKNNEIGLNCLEKWRSQCISWCKDFYDEENHRYADQKYLDTWVQDFPNEVKVLSDSVSGLAVWNINNYFLELRDNQLFSNGERIIFYHFHRLNIINKYWIQNGFSSYVVNENVHLDNLIYKPYINLIYKFNSYLPRKKEKTNFNNLKIFKVINSSILFYRFNKKILFRVSTDLILSSYTYLRKRIMN